MTNEELIAKIKAEIKRISSRAMNKEGQDLCEYLLSFLSTLESEKPMNLDFEQELYNRFGMVKDFTLGMRIARAFYDLGCTRTAEKYDEIEYNRQREEEETTRKEFAEELDKYFFGCTSSITMPECYKACEHFAQWGAEHLKK